MNDRELLELAAKAVGIKVFWGHPGSCQNSSEKLYRELVGRIMYTAPEWNPLTDDGDALRLAESLGLTICMNGSGTVSASDDYDKTVFATQSINECSGNRLTATRRAVVRAAAEIGRKMK